MLKLEVTSAPSIFCNLQISGFLDCQRLSSKLFLLLELS